MASGREGVGMKDSMEQRKPEFFLIPVFLETPSGAAIFWNIEKRDGSKELFEIGLRLSELVDCELENIDPVLGERCLGKC